MKRLLLIGLLAGCLAGCRDKKATPSASGPATPEPTGTGKNMTNFNASGTGAEQAVRKAVQRTVDGNAMKNLHLYIETASGASGQMPTSAQILASLKSDPEGKKTADLIDEGLIVLTNIKQREGVWAYDKNALASRGWVCGNNGVEQMGADDLKAKLKLQGQ